MIRGLFDILTDHIARAVKAAARGEELPDPERAAFALSTAQTVADLAGRSSVYATLRELQGKPRKAPVVKLPKVPNAQAITAITKREPMLASTAEAVADVYRRGGVTMIHAMDLTTVEHVQKRMATAVAEGLPTEDAARLIANDTKWPLSYARVVVRTNLATARADGLMSAMRDPEVKAMMPALEYVTAGDSRVRATPDERAEAAKLGRPPEDHRPLDGLIAPVDWVGWNTWTPPGGFQCRCRVIPVSTARLKSIGLGALDMPWSPQGDVNAVLRRAKFHPGFGGRRNLHP